MAITLRYTGTDTSGKTSELTYQEMNDNLKSYYYSSSLQSNTLVLYTTGSVSHSIDLSSYLDNTNTNIYTDNGTLTGARSVLADGNDLTFDFRDANFKVISDSSFNVTLENLANADTALVLGIDASGNIKAMATSSIPGQGGTDTNLYNINGTLTGNRTVTASGSNLTFSFADADFTIGSGGGAGGDVYIQDLRQASADSMMVINPGTGLVSWMYTSSLASGGTPGGSDTYVQFNDSGSFGGDSGFVYDKTNNKLTITSAGTGATANPTLQLGTSDTAIVTGDTIGRISFANTDASYGGGTSYAAIYAVAPSNWGGGNYPKDVRIAAVATAGTVDVATFKGSGVVQLHDYGSGNNTGTAAKWLAVDSSGNVLEENAPTTGADVTRPGSATTHTFNTDIVNSSNYIWTVELGSGGVSGTGKMRVGMTTSPKNANTVTAITFSTGSTTGNREVTLDYLQEGGTIAFRDSTGVTLVVDSFTIKEIDTSAAGYVTVYVSGGPSANIVNGTSYRVDFQSDARIELADQTYHRLALVNQSTNGANAVLVPNPSATFGDYIVVEAIAESGNQGAITLYHMHYSTGNTTSLDDRSKAVWWMNGTNTVSTISLDYSTYGQIAMAHFRVVNYGNPSLAYIGADRVLG